MSALVDDANAIFRAAVQRVQAPEILRRADAMEGTRRPLEKYGALRVVGMGKAAMAMAGAVEQRLAGRVDEGSVIVPEGYPESFPSDFPAPERVEVIEGGHPLPSRGSVRGARRILEIADRSTGDDLLVVLVSGGGTTLSTLPAEGLDLDDVKTTYRQLLRGGVEIHAMNAVRKHLTQVGGGQLAERAQPAEVLSLIISDVVGDDISVIASGPTAPDPSTYEDAVRTLYRYELWHDVPDPVRRHLAEGARGRRPDTPGEDAECFDRTTNTLLATNRTALDAAADAAEARGYEVQSLVGDVEGEARRVGARFARDLLANPPGSPACWIWGGETTVTVTGDGTGGRNQEVALGAALELDESDRDVVLLSGGTDGIDGPTDAAGAWGTPSTVQDARQAGCDPTEHLDDNDAYPLFDRINQLIRTGPTHTNVMDVQIGLVRPT